MSRERTIFVVLFRLSGCFMAKGWYLILQRIYGRCSDVFSIFAQKFNYYKTAYETVDKR